MKNSILSNVLNFIFFGVLFLGIRCTKVPDPLAGWGDKVTVVTGNFQTPSPTSVVINSSSVACRINNLAGKERGICWSESNSNVTVSGNKTPSGTGTGSFPTSITNLSPAKTYYYRAYIIIAPPSSALYGDLKSFSTPASCPSSTTTSTTLVTYTTATAGGNVTADGGATVTARGLVVSSTNATPTIGSDTNYPSGSGTGAFSVNLTNLTPGTIYYVRAYATNSAGTCYGSVVQFTTQSITCPPVVSTTASAVGATTATIGGNVTADGGATVTARGVVISITNPTPAIGSGTTYLSGSGTGAFTVNLTNLSPGTTYYVRAYATNSAGTCYGSVIQFTTSSVCATVNTTSASGISATTATTGGNVTNDGGATVTSRGVVISSTNSTPAIGSGTNYTSGSGTGAFTVNLTSLTPGTTYYVRAYATNAAGTCYGSVIQFTTGTVCATVSTTSASAIGATTATTGGNVTNDGGATVTSRGVVISSTNSTPAIGSGTNYTSGSGTGAFTVNLTSLSPGIRYYVRAYATNAAGTCYGSVIQFTTDPVCATVSTTAASAVLYTTATAGGNVTADGGATVTSRGVVISSTNTTPAIGSGTNYTSGSGTGAFTVNLTSLSPGIRYYVRAYATNAAGTCYGSVIQFMTLSITCPTVSTNVTTSIGSTTATSGGNVISNGGATVTGRGVVISSTNTVPTIGTGINYPGGSGTGSFVVNLSGLTRSTTYYVRAYATNSSGTCYGSTTTFTTTADCPTVTTSSMVRVNANTGNLGGNVSFNGGATVTARGVVINGTSYQIGSGIGFFSANFSPFQSGTTYSVKAYATNSAGTCYGNTITFIW